MKNKAEVNVSDNHGLTPLHWAASKGLERTVKDPLTVSNSAFNKVWFRWDFFSKEVRMWIDLIIEVEMLFTWLF